MDEHANADMEWGKNANSAVITPRSMAEHDQWNLEMFISTTRRQLRAMTSGKAPKLDFSVFENAAYMR